VAEKLEELAGLVREMGSLRDELPDGQETIGPAEESVYLDAIMWRALELNHDLRKWVTDEELAKRMGTGDWTPRWWDKLYEKLGADSTPAAQSVVLDWLRHD
jgi:hypothetical protein